MRSVLAALALVLFAAPALADLPAIDCEPLSPSPPDASVLDCGPLNAGFEACDGCAPDAGEMPTDWEPYYHPAGCDATRVGWSHSDARTGAASLRVDDLAAVCTGAVTPPIAILPGVNYRASFWARGEATARATVFVAFYESAEADLQDYLTKTPTRKTTTATWQEVAVTALAPPVGTHARIWVYADQDSAGTFFVDDADLRLVAV